MENELIRWEVGQEVEWPKVNPYQIVLIPGESAGRRNIHVADSGRFHVYWHREQDGKRYLVHHGGEEGFTDLFAAMRQHQRVILRYIGMSINLLPEEDEEAIAPQEDQTFPKLAERLEKLEIPGEQQIVNQWISTLQTVTRDLPRARSHGDLTGFREDLRLLLVGSLGRSINKHKQAAAQTLEWGIADNTRAGLLFAAVEANKQLLFRAHESVAITYGAMQRYNDLEGLQIYWNDIIKYTPYTLGAAAKVFAGADIQNITDRAAVRDIIRKDGGIRAKLAELKGEPYKSKAAEYIRELNKIDQLLGRRDYKAISKLLRDLTAKVEIFKREEVETQYRGVDFGKYALE